MTDDLRLPAVAARLVAWHNRHPLARRIGPAQVHGMGYVALPFVGPSAALPVAAGTTGASGAAVEVHADAAAPTTGGSLRERALARARQQQDPAAPTHMHTPTLAATADEAATGAGATGSGVDRATLQPDFSERFIDLLHPREVARFATRFGQLLSRAPSDGPLRQVAADGAQPGLANATVYLLTAVIETGTQKSRVLLGCGLNAPVLGRRLWSRPRLHGAALLTALMLAVPVLLWQAGGPAAVAPVGASPVATAASVASMASATTSVATETAASAGAAAAPTTTATTRTTSTSAKATTTATTTLASSAAAAATPPGGVAAVERGASAPAAAVPPQIPPAPAPRHPTAPPAAVVASAPRVVQAEAGTPAPAAAIKPAPTSDNAANVQGKPVSADAPIAAAPLPQAAAARRAFPPASAAAASVPSRFQPRLVGKLAPALPSIRPLISDEDKAKARATRERLLQQQARGALPRRFAIGGAAGASAGSVALARKDSPAQSGAQAAVVPPGSFALSTRPLRTHAEAEQMLVAMRSLLRGVDSGALKVEILPQGDDWRVVGWSFARRTEADKARALLVSRGLRVEVVAF